MPPLPWRRLVVWSVLGTLVVVAAVLVDLQRTGSNPLGLVQPGARGPAAQVFREDFPGTELLRGTGHDGQQLYAIARSPMHLDEVSEHLDRPRYRLQRPLFPLLAWALHPQGGGTGLVIALFVVGTAAVLIGGVATGALAVTVGGGPWAALLFALVPGTYVALRISTADGLALALAIAATALFLRGRQAAAVACGVAAVLTKESVLVVLVGVALGRRDRRSLALVAVPAAVACAWWLAVRLLVEATGRQVVELSAPFTGLWDAVVGGWTADDAAFAAAFALLTVTAAVAALATRRPRHPLWWAVALNGAFLVVLGPDVLALNLNGSRATAPALLLALLMLVTPRNPQRRTLSPPPAALASGP
ncbi:MAG: hypothetical protein IPM45_17495 [Acidimicrobiales bacterium]|nr:hypothetical protein [Acidimicrobiales bacterium]